ncbi:MAG: LysR family transcriptional regulator, partial [Oscillospiraceae bacterium]|nr:LysR family transcriptional regulator [Oscillospiraceae bacterium]
MEIRVLRYFLAVAYESNITKAANSLHVTQPTLSRQLKNLEDEIGKKLIIRHSHNITLTPDGIRLKNKAENIIAMIDRIETEFREPDEEISGIIHIGIGEGWHDFSAVTHTMTDLNKEYPGIRYDLYTGSDDEIIGRIDRGVLDMGIAYGPYDTAKYDCTKTVRSCIWGSIMKKDCPLAEKKSVTKDDLAPLPLICPLRLTEEGRLKDEFACRLGKPVDELNIIAT